MKNKERKESKTMRNCYNLDGIKTQLKKELARTTALREAWEKVTYTSKKDGTPFQNMSKNIIGAKYYKPDWTLQAGENRLKINTHCNTNGYIYDEIDCYCLVKSLTDEAKKAKPQNFQPKQSCFEQVYTYDLEDIKKAVESRINQLLERESELIAQIQNSEKVYNAFENAYAAAVEQLAHASGKEKDCTLFYMVLETVKERYPYC